MPTALFLISFLPSKPCRCFCMVALLNILFSDLIAQEVSHTRTFSVADGLSNAFVNALAQDHEGYVWIGTSDGLNRYDGHEFKKLLVGEQVETLKLFVDDRGKIWSLIRRVRTGSEIIMVDPQTWEITRFNWPQIDLSHRDLAARNGQIYLITEKSVYQLFSDNRNPEKLFTFPGDMVKASTAPLKLENGNWAIGTHYNGVVLLKPDGSLVNEHFLGGPLTDLWIENGNLWITNNNTYKVLYKGSTHLVNPVFKNIRHLNGETEDATKTLLHNHYSKALRDVKNNLWIGTDNGGLKVYFKAEGKFLVLDLFENFSDISSIILLKDGSYFIGTSHGLIHVNLEETGVTTLFDIPSNTLSVRGVAEDKEGNVFIGTYGSFYRKPWGSPNTEKVKTVSITRANGRVEYFQDSLSENMVEFAMLADDSLLWIADEGRGLIKYNQSDLTMQVYGTAENYFYHATSVLKDTDGTIWVGGDSGVQRLIKGTKVLEDIGRKTSNFGGVIALYENKKGDIWAASVDGLFVKAYSEEIFRHYQTTGGQMPLKGTGILSMFENAEGKLWLGTHSGLILLDLATGTINRFTVESHGLSSNSICSVLEDNDGYLWLSSFNGLMRFDPNTYHVNAYFESSGLTNSEFNRGSYFKGSDGKLYFGGVQGLNIIEPRVFAGVSKDLPIMLDRVQKFDGKDKAFIAVDWIPEMRTPLELGYRDHSLTLRFALADFHNPKENQYAYRIIGLDTAWRFLGNNRELIISSLPSGLSEIQIKARGKGGSWNKEWLKVPVYMQRAFYEKPEYIITGFIILLLALYGLYRWRTIRLLQQQKILEHTVIERTQEINDQKTQIEHQAEELKALDKLKSRFFTNISHELRTPLTLISAPLKRWSTKHGNAFPESDELKVVQRNANNLLSLVDEILDLSKLEASKLELNVNEVRFDELINRVVFAFESMAITRDIRLLLQYELPKNCQVFLDARKYEKIVNNLLSNAFKHSYDGSQILVHVTKDEGQTNLSVIDQGQGIHPNDLPFIFDRFYQSKHTTGSAIGGTGVGLALSKALANLMQGSLTATSEPDKGSRFTLTVPMQYAEGKVKGVTELQRVEIAQSVIGEEPVKPSADKHRVLVVEDHRDMRAFVKDILEEHYNVDTAVNGRKAIDLLKSNEIRPELIVTDVMMPEMDGLQLLSALRKDERWRSIPVVMLTAKAAQEDRIQALVTGVDDYLAKPFDPDELLARCFSLLSNYQLRNQWKDQFKPEEEAEESIDSWDTNWLSEVELIIQREVANSRFKVSDLAYELAVSKSQLLRKIKSITGLTPEQFVREVKLQKARSLLENRAYATISEVAYAVGFETSEYFSKRFAIRFGKRPADYFAKISS